MKLKDVVYQHFIKIQILGSGILFAILGLILRVQLTGTFYLLFLVWNLILSLIPLAITLFLHTYPEVLATGWKRVGVFIIWLLFLPNAPYVITDFIHIQNSVPHLMLLDFLLIASFATTAFLGGVYSIQMMRTLYLLFYSITTVRILGVLVCMLSGFGVYLGRFIRLNSWDIFLRPWYTLVKIFIGLTDPMAWAITIIFGLLLLLSLLGFGKTMA